MRLADLEPEFNTYREAVESHPDINGGVASLRRSICRAASLADAQGVWFLCPACFLKNGGPVGTHMVDVTFAGRGVPDHLGSQSRNGGPSRWAVSGTDFNDLTLQPSVDCGCWHGHITTGEAT